MPRSAWIYPALGMVLFVAATMSGYSFAPSAGGWLFAAVLLVILFGTVFAAVHHAEMIAERWRTVRHAAADPMAITIIEVALIATIMLNDKPAPTRHATPSLLWS
jgi:Ca2+:H+ antiporter